MTFRRAVPLLACCLFTLACPRGEGPSGQCCEAPLRYNPATDSCECTVDGGTSCPAGRTFDPSACACRCATCPAPQVIADSNTCQCACPDSAAANCQGLPAGYSFNQQTCRCECAPRQCAFPTVFNPERCACECPACPAPQVLLDRMTCQCGCPAAGDAGVCANLLSLISSTSGRPP